MSTEAKIAGLCLYGFIRKESQKDQARCLCAIEQEYGQEIAGIVKSHLHKR